MKEEKEKKRQVKNELRDSDGLKTYGPMETEELAKYLNDKKQFD